MTGLENSPQASLFYSGINLEKRVRSNHVLREVARLVDFDFVYGDGQRQLWIGGSCRWRR
jgi:hypothetical protein